MEYYEFVETLRVGDKVRVDTGEVVEVLHIDKEWGIASCWCEEWGKVLDIEHGYVLGLATEILF